MASGKIIAIHTQWKTLIGAKLTFQATFSLLPNGSFSLSRTSLVRCEASFNDSRPIALAVKAGTGDFNQVLGGAYVNPDKIGGKFTGLSFTTILAAGTYYMWGQSTTNNTSNAVTVQSITFI